MVRRGDVTLWLTPEAITTWAAAGAGKRRGQLRYSDHAIETALTLRLVFHLPLRQSESFLTSIFEMLGLDLSAPDHTTVSRRGQHLALTMCRAPVDAGFHLGGREPGRRRWKKVLGYHRQARVENAFFRYKSIIGPGLRACSPSGQEREAVLACNILSRMTELGRPKSYSIGR